MFTTDSFMRRVRVSIITTLSVRITEASVSYNTDPEAVCSRTDHNGGMMNKAEEEKLREVLLHSEKPSEYFEELRNNGILEKEYPVLAALVGVEQNPKYHPEGDVFTHTMLVLDAAASLRDKARDPLAFMLAALLHDTGKACKTTNENGRIRSIGHENVSADLADRFLRDSGFESQRKTAVNLTKLHMRPNMLAKDHSRVRATNKLFAEALDPEDLILLAEADRGGRTDAADFTPNRTFLNDRYRMYREKTEDKP
mgnify:CR=1 FL=1